ncbi:DedA family protein [Miltoncostaea marina]|uniref:DedA family protein n=1 Tax=Miltoncostaea marina TaxID=2843215 RepID=UPI001C3CC533|nr:VTT domain-containing protein [Miltoncostaea marina]
MLESLTDAISGSPLTYLVVALLVGGDAILPLFPGESAVVTAAVLADEGELQVWLIGLAAFAGAFAGDLLMFLIGRRFGPRAVARFASEGRGAERVRWAQEQLDVRGVPLIVAAQFIPGGRNIVMLVAGTLHFPLRRFLLAEAAGAAIWATFQTSIGYFGGRLIENTLVALVVSLAIAIAVGALVELAGRLRRRLAA